MLVPRDGGTLENAPLIFPSLWRKYHDLFFCYFLFSPMQSSELSVCVLRLQSSDVSTFFPFLVSSGSESAYWKYVQVLFSIRKPATSGNLITEWMNHLSSCLQVWNPQTWSCSALILHCLLYREQRWSGLPPAVCFDLISQLNFRNEIKMAIYSFFSGVPWKCDTFYLIGGSLWSIFESPTTTHLHRITLSPRTSHCILCLSFSVMLYPIVLQLSKAPPPFNSQNKIAFQQPMCLPNSY